MTGLSPHEFVGRSEHVAHVEPTVRVISGANYAQGGWYRDFCQAAEIVPPEFYYLEDFLCHFEPSPPQWICPLSSTPS